MPRLPSLRRPPIAFAHRGARAHARENTMEAFHLALRLGATGLESDAWVTSAGVVVLDHDGVARRMTRRRPISQVTAAELPSHVPTLEAFYELCGDTVEVSLDLKDPAAAPRVIDVAAACGGSALQRLWLCHHDLEVVASWRALSSEVRLVDSTRLRLVEEGIERRAARLRSLGVDALNLHHSDWNGGQIALVHRFERFAFAWDAQLSRVIAELLDAGIDAVYGDHVDRLVEAIGGSENALGSQTPGADAP